jgi:hypothetical protein
MPDEQGYDPRLPLRDVIASLLRLTLPDAPKPLIERLADEALTGNRYIAPYADACWGDLSESAGDLVAQEVGLIAREASQRMVWGRGKPT